MINSPVRGKVVSLTANTMSIKQDGAGGFSSFTIGFEIPAEAKVVCDGRVCRIKDIKKGDSVVVEFSSKPGDMGVRVTQVEVQKSSTP
jgi:hypothetical protein